MNISAGIRKAQINDEVEDDKRVFVQLPPGSGGNVTHLRQWWYRWRSLADAWKAHYMRQLSHVRFP